MLSKHPIIYTCISIYESEQFENLKYKIAISELRLIVSEIFDVESQDPFIFGHAI